MEVSPAIERAVHAIQKRVADRGEPSPLMTDWFAILLDDEDGHPAALLRKLDIGWEAARSVAFDEPAHQRPGPTPDAAVVRSRELSIALRGDPTPTTDMLFLAILEAAEAIGGGFASLGAGLSRAALLYQLPAEESEPAPVATDFTIDDSAGRDSTARILDAALNRARESLRVLDDYARFALNDRILTEDVKSLRHDLATAGEQLPKRHLLAFRDTGNDVGTRLEAPAEYRRETPNHVAAVNLKRLQEALRSIEEYGKIHGASFARAIEQIRYRAYTLEQAICSRDTATPRLAEARLYLLVTGSQCQHSLDWTIREAAAGGTDIVQLREKALTDRDLLSRARLIRHWTRESGLLFIVNDRPDIARLCDADGVHLGQDDLSVSEARRIVGPDALIGVSTHSPEQLRQAVRDGADYVGIGPVFPSSTKSFNHFPGLDFVRHAADSTTLPAFALGGITPGNAGRIAEAGLLRIAVASAVTASDDPQAACRALRQALSRT